MNEATALADLRAQLSEAQAWAAWFAAEADDAREWSQHFEYTGQMTAIELARLKQASTPRRPAAFPGPRLSGVDDVVSEIDQRVIEQLQQEPSGYDHNINQAVCELCGGDWHGQEVRTAGAAARPPGGRRRLYGCPGANATPEQRETFRRRRTLGLVNEIAVEEYGHDLVLTAGETWIAVAQPFGIDEEHGIGTWYIQIQLEESKGFEVTVDDVRQALTDIGKVYMTARQRRRFLEHPAAQDREYFN